MIINTNISAVNANRLLNINNKNTQNDIERLSSGKRINKAADDAAGLAVSQKLISQYQGLDRATKNAQDAASFVQTTEGYMAQLGDNLHRLRNLAVQSANGIYNQGQRALMEKEVDQIKSEIDRISVQAQFNQIYPLNGSLSTESFVAHIGANADESISVNIPGMSTKDLQINNLNISSSANSEIALASVDKALDSVVSARTTLGAFQNRLEAIEKSNNLASENMLASSSSIVDADMAKEMSNFTKDNILTQTTTAMLAQANAQSQGILKLLQS